MADFYLAEKKGFGGAVWVSGTVRIEGEFLFGRSEGESSTGSGVEWRSAGVLGKNGDDSWGETESILSVLLLLVDQGEEDMT